MDRKHRLGYTLSLLGAATLLATILAMAFASAQPSLDYALLIAGIATTDVGALVVGGPSEAFHRDT